MDRITKNNNYFEAQFSDGVIGFFIAPRAILSSLAVFNHNRGAFSFQDFLLGSPVFNQPTANV